MLIKLHVVRYRDAHEDIDEEIINTDHIARMAPCDIPDSLAKTYLFFPEQPMWQQIKVTESMDDILKVSNKADYRELAYTVGRGVRLLLKKQNADSSEIRWTDKVSVMSNGDIIDFEGQVIGHINLENYEEETHE